MLPQEIIRRKRDGHRLAPAEIGSFVAGLTDGGWSEGQVAALAMAVFLRGMDEAERVALTLAMTRSGASLDWRALDLPGPVLDKHSTGGVGDKVSLVLAPLVAACGGFVPMISGRGLGHSGGTLDKFDAIPGYRTAPDLALFRRVVREVGCAVIGQTADLAPADRRLYAIRDVTATVESVPLITASILSKKLAAGLEGLVMDVKAGSGAFCPDLARARELAAAIVATAKGAGLRTRALITDMNQALGRSAGNAVEMREAVDLLIGKPGEPRLREVTLELAAAMLRLGGLADDAATARRRAERALASGAAAERFERMVAGLGGPADFLARADSYLTPAPVIGPCHATGTGSVAAIDTRALGLIVVALGGGRTNPAQGIDHRVGLTEIAGIGESVDKERPLAVIHAADEAAWTRAAASLRGAFILTAAAPPLSPVVIETI